MEMERVKIFLNNGHILTVKIDLKTDTQIMGTDKFGTPVIILISDIKSMLPAGDSNGK